MKNKPEYKIAGTNFTSKLIFFISLMSPVCDFSLTNLQLVEWVFKKHPSLHQDYN